MNKEGFDLLPKSYDENLIGFFPQGPGVVFVYWELAGSQWDVVTELGGAVLIRLYRVLAGGGFDYEYVPVREVSPPPGTNSWYFSGLNPDSTYSVDIGCKLPDGSFFPLVKSENATTPPVPRFDAAPKRKEIGREPVARLPETRPAGGQVEIAGNDLVLVEIFESMPFYMGYDTELMTG